MSEMGKGMDGKLMDGKYGMKERRRARIERNRNGQRDGWESSWMEME